MREGAACSPCLWAVYADGLLLVRRKSRLGCHVAGQWMGGFLYADDISLQQNLNFDADAATRRAGFIGRSVEVRDQFSSASPAHVLKAVRILCCHGYGAVLWPLDSSSASSFFKACNSCVKRVFRLPVNTFTYLVEGHLNAGAPLLRNMVLGRYPTFYQNLKPDEPRLWYCLRHTYFKIHKLQMLYMRVLLNLQGVFLNCHLPRVNSNTFRLFDGIYYVIWLSDTRTFKGVSISLKSWTPISKLT